MSRSDDPLRHLSPTIRILASLIDAMVADDFHEWRVMAALETAIMRESKEREGFTRSQAEQVMVRRGWKSVEDSYKEAGIPEKHWPVVDLVLSSDFSSGRREGGFTNAEIARYTGHPVRTVKLWIHDDTLRLAKLDLGDLS